MDKKQLIIGIGKPGRNILSSYATTIPKLYIDTDPDVLELENSLRIGEKTCGKYSALGEFAKGELSLIESKNEIISILNDYSSIYLVTSLGGGTTSGATKRLVDLCIEMNKKVHVFAGIPLQVEGGRRFQLAMDSLIYLELVTPITVINYNRYIPEGRYTLGQLFKKMDEKFHAKLTNLLNDTNCVD